MRFSLLLLIGSLFIAQGAAAQGRVKRYTTPLAGKVTLSEVVDKYNAQVYSMEMPDPDADAEQKKLEEIKKQISLKFPRQADGSRKKTSSSVPSPVVDISFVADSMSGIPPDNCSAVSRGGKAVSVMNSTIAVHDAATGAYQSRKSLKVFSVSVGLNNFSNDYRYDPKVLYDPEADKFICIMLNGTVAYNYIVIGFSKTNDPNGAWNFYKFYGNYAGDTTWFDYPAIAVTKNEFFFTGNKIMFDSSWQAGFTQTLIYQVRKEDGYNGDTVLNYQIWDSVKYNNRYLRCLYPLNPGDTLQGPSQYFLSNRNFDVTNDSVFLVQVPDTIGSADSFLRITPLVSSLNYGVPPNGRQPDTTKTLATNDGRVLGGFIRGDEIQFVSTSVNPSSGAAGIYHGIISNFRTAPVVTGRIFSIDTLDFGYPNISFTGNVFGQNHSIISFEYTGPTTYPGLGAILFDGNNFSDLVKVKTGDGSISRLSGKEQRWGDYSGNQPDWSSLGSVWIEGIYGRKDHLYGNYLARLSSPFKVGVPTVHTAAKTAGKLYPNPAFEFISFEFSVDQEQGFSFMVYDMQGRVVDKLTDHPCKSGRNLITFNIAPLAPGTYFLKAVGQKGETIDVHTFLRK